MDWKDTPFFMTDASKEDKIKYYRKMEDDWNEVAQSIHRRKTLGTCAFGVLAISTLCLPDIIAYGRGFTLPVYARLGFLVIGGLAMLKTFLYAKEIIAGNHLRPPTELVLWWNYAKESYGINPDFEKENDDDNH